MKTTFFIFFLIFWLLLPPIFFGGYSAERAIIVIACEAHLRPKTIGQLLKEDPKKWLKYLDQESDDCP